MRKDLKQNYDKFQETYTGLLFTQFTFDIDQWKLTVVKYHGWFKFRAVSIFDEECGRSYFEIVDPNEVRADSNDYAYLYNSSDYHKFKADCHNIISRIYHPRLHGEKDEKSKNENR